MIATPEPSDHLRVVAVIEARIDRAQPSGAVLLETVVAALERSQFIEHIAIATSTDGDDDFIVEYARAHEMAVVRGARDDVLACFARAAELMDADIVVRVVPDSHAVDAGFIDHLIAALIEQNADYVIAGDGGGQGVEPFSRRALDKLMMDAREDAVARERVTGYFRLHPDFVRIARAPRYATDIVAVDASREQMTTNDGEASLDDLFRLLDREPRTKSSPARQKSSGSIPRLALLRCDAGGPFGYGPVKRMMALARVLRERDGIGAIFAVHGTDDALASVRRAGFEAHAIDVASDEAALGALIGRRRPDILVCDQKEGIGRGALARLAEKVAVTAVIDDASPRRLAADRAYYPPMPQARALDWSGSGCAVRVGWEWAVLGVSCSAAPWRRASPRPTLLVTMGGSDPAGLTLRCARALSRLDPVFRARFVIGPGVDNGAQLARAIVALAPHFETVEGADGLATEFASCDLALAAFGVTAYELAAFGTPALYLCRSEDHARAAAVFEGAGLGRSLGPADDVSDREIAGAVMALVNEPQTRREMRAAGPATVDGDGATRIAADLAEALAQYDAKPAVRAAR